MESHTLDGLGALTTRDLLPNKELCTTRAAQRDIIRLYTGIMFRDNNNHLEGSLGSTVKLAQCPWMCCSEAISPIV